MSLLLNQDFDRLVKLISQYAYWQRGDDSPLMTDGKFSTMTELRSFLVQTLPELAKKFDSGLPDVVYIKQIIDFGVRGIDEQITTQIWKRYFLAGESISEVASFSFYATRSAHRQLSAFARRVATQLWEKNYELSNPLVHLPSPVIMEQHRKDILGETFHLTDREAEVALVFCQPGKKIGRRAIARKLAISLNTLKVYCRKIIRKVGGQNMNEAATIIRDALRHHPGAGWED